jgi:hypothetical protein
VADGWEAAEPLPGGAERGLGGQQRLQRDPYRGGDLVECRSQRWTVVQREHERGDDAGVHAATHVVEAPRRRRKLHADFLPGFP